MTIKDDILDAFGHASAYFLHDIFLSSEPYDTAVTGTGSVQIRMADTIMSTGILSTSTARLNYTYSLFNPRYSTVFIRERVNSMKDTLVYFGFMETLETPSLTMTQSHAGVFISDGVAYWSVGNGSSISPTYRNISMPALDFTRDIIVKQHPSGMQYYPLPVVQPYFEQQPVKSELRKWSNNYSTGSLLPKDQAHYFVWFIKNTTGIAKLAYIKNFTINEEHRD